MDNRLEVRDVPRSGTSRQLAETPLLSVAWQLLQLHYQRLGEERRQLLEEIERLVKALAAVAVLSFRLERRKLVGDTSPQGASGDALRLVQEECAKGGIRLLGEEDVPYCGELMDVIDNIARLPVPGLVEPRIHEIITPAVVYRGRLIMAGKAVIAVPVCSPYPDADAPESEQVE